MNVLADESIGGLQREYREVKRKAAVGERIKIVDAVNDSYDHYDYRNGEEYEVRGMYGAYPIIWPDGTGGSEIYLNDNEYRVLVPLDTPLSSRPAHEQQAEIIANLAARMAALETERDMVGQALSSAEGRIKTLEGIIADKYGDGVFNPFSTESIAAGLAKLAGGERKASPLTRDDVIERAKADVTELALNDSYNESRRKKSGKNGPFYLFAGALCTYAEFVVNREKRTVVCLLRGYCSHDVLERGKSRCTPDDVFNVHIGKAIALRRALGLEIPDEYVNSPKPTEVRVGDIVAWDRECAHYRVVRPATDSRHDKLIGIWCCYGQSGWKAYATDFEGASILDDSREEVPE